MLYDSGFYNESIVHFYYSMYALAKILLLNKDITTKSHEGTINMIQVHYVETGELDKRFHKGLASSGSLRNVLGKIRKQWCDKALADLDALSDAVLDYME